MTALNAEPKTCALQAPKISDQLSHSDKSVPLYSCSLEYVVHTNIIVLNVPSEINTILRKIMLYECQANVEGDIFRRKWNWLHSPFRLHILHLG